VPDIIADAHTGNEPSQAGRRVAADQEYQRVLYGQLYFKLFQNSGNDELISVEAVMTPRFDTPP
jgi:hypothetical protein